MNDRLSTLRVGAVLPLPVAVVLGILFFMPWVTLSCDTQAAWRAGELSNLTTNQWEKLDRNNHLVQASGWQLARGEVRKISDSDALKNSLDPSEGLPVSRMWIYAGLGLPILLFLVSFMRISGGMAPGRAGGWMIVAGVAGVVLTLVVFFVNYAEDVTAKFEAA